LFIRYAQVEIPSIVIAAGRLLIATLVLAPLALKNGVKEFRLITRSAWFLLLLSGTLLGLHFATWITSLEYTSIASSVVLVTTAPLWVALFSPLLLKEKVTTRVLIGLVISLIGSFIVGASSTCEIVSRSLTCSGLGDLVNRNYLTGNLLALMGAFFSAGYLMAGRRVRNSVNLPLYTFIVYGTAALILCAMVWISGARIVGYSAQAYTWIIALALIPQVIGHSAFNWALKYLPASYVSIALLGEPIGTVLLAYVFLSEAPTTPEIIGGVLILAGIVVSTQLNLARRDR
jgi:drug/metabolite transporter (DMT)-like permease